MVCDFPKTFTDDFYDNNCEKIQVIFKEKFIFKFVKSSLCFIEFFNRKDVIKSQNEIDFSFFRLVPFKVDVLWNCDCSRGSENYRFKVDMRWNCDCICEP